jgi:hypothetical protein
MVARRPLLPCLAFVLALPLAACSGTPFGEQLSDSFSGPPSGEQPGGTGPGAAPPVQQPQANSTPGPNVPTAPTGTPSSATPATRPALPGPAALAPAPYRLILRLPASDPAAPAEAVTEALRAAGVSFEVETIERVPAANAPSEPVPAPQPPSPAPPPLPAPAARPAPAPR